MGFFSQNGLQCPTWSGSDPAELRLELSLTEGWGGRASGFHLTFTLPGVV